MSDQQPEPTSGETGTLGAGPAAPDMSAPAEPVAAAAEVEAPQTRARAGRDLAEGRRAQGRRAQGGRGQGRGGQSWKLPRLKLPRSKRQRPRLPKIDAVKPEAPRFPGKVMIMSPGDRVGMARSQGRAGGGIVRQAPDRRDGCRGGAGDGGGALGGALATAGVGKLMAGDSARRHRRRTARSKPRWRGSMPILSR